MTRSSVETTLAERGKVYGCYDNVARTAQALKQHLRNGATWHSLNDAQHESIEMICNKLARIVNGSADYADSWHDIAGYATLIVAEIAHRANDQGFVDGSR